MAGLSLLLVVAGALLWTATRDQSQEVPPGSQPGAQPVSGATAAQTVQQVAQAWSRGDEAGARALAADGSSQAADQLAAVAANARDLQVTGLRMRYVDDAGAPAADESRPVDVDLTWQLRGQDTLPARAEIRLAVTADGRVASVGGGDRTPVWLTERLVVRRVDGAVVAVAESLGEGVTARYVSLVRRAVPDVRRAVPSWDGHLVVEVPSTPDAVDHALGVPAGTYARVAAVTGSADGTTAPDSPVRVVVNPDKLARLGRTGAQVVLTHEVAHVALGSAVASAAVPVWLTEGIADVVALRDVDLPLSAKAGQVRAQVRRDGVPDHLPGEAEFDTVTGAHLGAAYESAWLACEVVVDAAGLQGLVDLYRDVDAGVPLARALRDRAGMTEAELTRRWQQRLSDLAA